MYHSIFVANHQDLLYHKGIMEILMPNTMGQVLRVYILEQFSSIQKFSEDSGFQLSSIYNWVNDRHPIPLHQIALLGEYFSEYRNEPPQFIIMRLVIYHPEVIKVIHHWQQQKKGSQ